jgi:hypothetical protein
MRSPLRRLAWASRNLRVFTRPEHRAGCREIRGLAVPVVLTEWSLELQPELRLGSSRAVPSHVVARSSWHRARLRVRVCGAVPCGARGPPVRRGPDVRPAALPSTLDRGAGAPRCGDPRHLRVRPEFLTQLFSRVWAWPLTLLLVAGLGLLFHSLVSRRDARAFAGSALALAGLLASSGAALYPTLLRSTFDSAFSLDAQNAAARTRGLSIGLAWSCVGLPLAVAYGLFLFRFSLRLSDGSARMVKFTPPLSSPFGQRWARVSCGRSFSAPREEPGRDRAAPADRGVEHQHHGSFVPPHPTAGSARRARRSCRPPPTRAGASAPRSLPGCAAWARQRGPCYLETLCQASTETRSPHGFAATARLPSARCPSFPAASLSASP